MEKLTLDFRHVETLRDAADIYNRRAAGAQNGINRKALEAQAKRCTEAARFVATGRLVNHSDYAAIPQGLTELLDAYATKRRRCGHFLSAVLENDLSKAIAHADPQSTAHLPAIVRYVGEKLPTLSHGSAEIVQRWLDSDDVDPQAQ